ncbi:hypothetical protein RN001_010859 [Aquatica leii]|uniref:Invertebrate defensins family profile domain-containing protein n=1 Tax=Aquatica leii TaxID=1421715 RepID=A0AAN7SNG5_9COLE|nr:hypothetical protein RN001_010859 [Aquatica leii]
MNKILLTVVIASFLIAFVASLPINEEDEILAEPISNLREKRAVSCRSVSSQPNNPSSYYEACRAHCILNGRRGGSCSGGSCSCY